MEGKQVQNWLLCSCCCCLFNLHLLTNCTEKPTAKNSSSSSRPNRQLLHINQIKWTVCHQTLLFISSYWWSIGKNRSIERGEARVRERRKGEAQQQWQLACPRWCRWWRHLNTARLVVLKACVRHRKQALHQEHLFHCCKMCLWKKCTCRRSVCLSAFVCIFGQMRRDAVPLEVTYYYGRKSDGASGGHWWKF